MAGSQRGRRPTSSRYDSTALASAPSGTREEPHSLRVAHIATASRFERWFHPKDCDAWDQIFAQLLLHGEEVVRLHVP